MHVKSRPVPLTRREDLSISPIEFRGNRHWVLKDSVGLRYNLLSPEQYFVWERLNGEVNLEMLREQTQAAFPLLQIDHQSIQSLLVDLHQKSIVIGNRFNQAEPLLAQKSERSRQELMKLLMSPFFIKFPGIHPGPLLKISERVAGGLFNRFMVFVSLAVILLSLIVIGMNSREVALQAREFERFFIWPNLLYLWVTVGFTKLVHEIGHGVSCRRFGRECHSIGFALLVFSPTLYCDATDSWMLRSKWKRIAVAAAGMYVEVLLASIAILLWATLNEGLLRHLCFNLFVVSAVTTVIFNANPLIRFDGYYILSDWLEIPNLRTKSTQLLQRSVAWCLGSELTVDHTLPSTGRSWFVLYAVSSAIYRVFIVSGIFAVLMTALTPYRLQSLGIAWAVVSGGLMLFGVSKSVVQAAKMQTQQPRNRWRLAATMITLLSLTIGILMIPVPFVVSSSFVIRPNKAVTVYISEPGQLAERYVESGDTVTLGSPIVRVTNRELVQEAKSLKNEIKQIEKAMLSAESIGALSEHVRLEAQLRGLKDRIRELDERLEGLTVHAPISGVVSRVEGVPVPTLENREDQLARWSGDLLSQQNEGAWLETSVPVATITPVKAEFRAELTLPQSKLRSLFVGQTVRLSLDGCPEKVFKGVVAEIGRQNVRFAPMEVSGNVGGTVVTTPDSQGRERPVDQMYPIKVKLTLPTPALISGLRGRARVIVAEDSLGQWAYRWMRETFRYRL